MKNLFVPYEVAKLAKEKGFTEECMAFYGEGEKLQMWNCKVLGEFKGCKNEVIKDFKVYPTAPLYQQLIDWFSSKHNIEIELKRDSDGYFIIEVKKWCKFKSWGGDIEDYVMQFSTCESQDRYESYNIGFKEAFKLI